MVAVAAAAIVVAGVSGCMLKKPSNTGTSSGASSGASSSSTSSPPATTSSWAGGQTRVVINGQDQGVTENADCTMTSGTIVITIMQGAADYSVHLTDGNPPDVDDITLSNPKNRISLNYMNGMGDGSAQATKKGNAFVITGAIIGTTGSNQGKVSTPFEVDAVCSSSASPGTSGTSSPSAGGQTKVIIDGQDQGVTGNVDCIMSSGTINIVIQADPASYNAELTDANPPDVRNVMLSNPKNGLSLNYMAGMGEGSAQATRDGNNFKITGTATGTAGSNKGQVSKPFEIDAACTSS
jgi:lipoprotein LpqH